MLILWCGKQVSRLGGVTIAVRFSHRETDRNALWKVKLRKPVSTDRQKVTQTHTHMHACTHMHTHTHTCMARTHACTHTHIHSHTHYACMSAHMHTHTHTPYPCICTHTHTHTHTDICLHTGACTHMRTHTHTDSSTSNTKSLFWGKLEFGGKCDQQSG